MYRTTAMIRHMCLPVKIYLICILLGVILAFTKPNIASNLIRGLIVDIIYVSVMIWACNAGYVSAAWILLFLPIIILVFLVLILGLFVTGTIKT